MPSMSSFLSSFLSSFFLPLPFIGLLEKIADLVNDKKLEGIADLRDETDREGMRMVIELKKDAVPAVVQNNLFKKTALQASFSGNMLALVEDGTQPRRVTLREALKVFIDFRYVLWQCVCVFLLFSLSPYLSSSFLPKISQPRYFLSCLIFSSLITQVRHHAAPHRAPPGQAADRVRAGRGFHRP